MPLFHVNEANLQHCRDVVDAYGQAWIHGDGNVYHEEGAHKFRRDFSNPIRPGEPGAGSYWAKFTDSDDVPDTVDELKELFLKNKERTLEKMTEEKSKKNEVTVLQSKKTPPPTQQDPHAEEKAKLDAKESDLNDWSDKLTKQTHEAAATQKTLNQKANELSSKEADLEAREKALNEKLAALKKGENKDKPAGQ